MAVTPRTYVPLLRWRQGEYEALFRLDPVQKSRIIPLLELLPPDYDFEQRKPKKDLLVDLERPAEILFPLITLPQLLIHGCLLLRGGWPSDLYALSLLVDEDIIRMGQ